MLFIIYLFYIKMYYFSERMFFKYSVYIIYVYLGIILINALVNIIYLGLIDLDFLNSLINSAANNSIFDTKDYKSILKMFQDTELAEDGPIDIESSKKVASVNDNDNKYEGNGNKSTFLDIINRRILSTNSCYFPSHFQKNGLPAQVQDVPIYGNKLVTFKPSSLLQNRNLPPMSIEIPKDTSMVMSKLTELHKAIDGADEAVKLYDTQFIKFNKVLSDIKNGTEEFYPDDAKPLMETYVDLVAKLSNQQKVMANEAITQLNKLDSKFSRDLYPVGHSHHGSGTSTPTGTSIVSVTGSVTPTGTSIVPVTGSGNNTGSSM